MASWFGWSEPQYRSPRRDPAEVVTDTLMLELSWQLKEAERLQRERDSQYRRLQTGVDYSWLVSSPRTSYDVPAGERLALEDLCAKVPPSYCGSVILRFRQVLMENEPEVQEVSGLFRSVLLESLERFREEAEAQRLSRQWNNKRAVSMSLLNLKSRVRINPFGSTVGLTANGSAVAGSHEAYEAEVKTVSEDVEKGQLTERTPRVWSMPDFRHQGINGHAG
ncbi:protein RD3 [Denticeps clupeoides]|uniref:Retinal degeneration 3, GUCY2D regulator n=1 Tax=Denticeps clupeoides TaxID=299321 RepID=A0AAY4ET39_9TELE|nr:protein RD3 [Denticeps clupeoides]